MAAAVIGLAPTPSRATPTTCSGSAMLEARVVANPTTGAGAEVAAWDVALTCGKNCERKSERWTRRVRAVVRWFPDARGA